MAHRTWSAAAVSGGRPARAGGFNLYDGIIQHKLLGLHQVRAEALNNLPYDLMFIGLATMVLLAGLLLLRLGRFAESRAT